MIHNLNLKQMISNPPFSIQNDIIKRSFWLVDAGYVKSFALLLPLATLETITRANMYEQYIDKLSFIIFKNRIKFLGHDQVFNKGCCWVCYNIPALKGKTLSWCEYKVDSEVKKKQNTSKKRKKPLKVEDEISNNQLGLLEEK